MANRHDPFQEYRNLSGIAPMYLSESAAAEEAAEAAKAVKEHAIVPEETEISKNIGGARAEWDIALENRRNAHEEALKEIISGMREDRMDDPLHANDPIKPKGVTTMTASMGKPKGKKSLKADKGMKAIQTMKAKKAGC